MKPAVFLDRDGTIIEQVHHLIDPADVRLIPGAAEALRAFHDAGFLRVVVTNQSVIGRGLLTVEGLAKVHERMNQLLAAQGAGVDGIYFCPAAPIGDDRTAVEHPDRKPAPGMLLTAAGDLDIDLAQSWMIGDMISDIGAGTNAGCRGTVLVRTGYGRQTEQQSHGADAVVDDLSKAVALILGASFGSSRFSESNQTS